MVNDGSYLDYPTKVLNGEIVAGLYVKQACSRFFEWLKRDDLLFRPDRAEKVITFVSKFRHYKGKSAKQPFILSDWQRFIIYNIYGFYWQSNPDKRVIRNVYLECARKQGKSMFIAALSLYALLADGEPSAECYVVANSAKQADNLYTMCRTLATQLDPKQKFIKSYRDTLKFTATKSHLKTLSFNPTAADGFNASFVVTDEYHAAPNSAMYDVMKSSQLQRLNPLNIVITTAGHNLFSPCYEMRNTCIDILAGVKQDDTQAMFIYELDENDQWDDPSNYQKSNPNLNVTIDPVDITAEVNRAKNNEGTKAEVMTKTLNIWLQSAETWIGADIVNRNTSIVDLKDYSGMTCYIGVDLAAVSDLTAISCLIPTTDKFIFKTWYFLPFESLKSGVNSTAYQRYKRNGMLDVTPGNVTDYDYILNKIQALQTDFNLYIGGIYYDSWNATQFAINATAQGLPMFPYSQSIGSFNKPTKEFERLLKSDRVTIDNNDITRWCISNVAIKTDWNENAKPVKSGADSEKIDGVISMIQALGGYLTTEHYDNTITV